MVNFQQQDYTVFVDGRLTQSQVAQLWTNRHQLFTEKTQVVDLSALEYADSAGIALLISLIRADDRSPASDTDTRKLVNPSPQLQKMIALYDLDAFFTIQ
ncbi:lipid asymmetry maintenance protein MlaB [Shewanella maritima]|uniref:STAS domain-containing protein n=1 Tax=Shewanella maritima TaxID=2520507 RepID=UPI0037351BD6